MHDRQLIHCLIPILLAVSSAAGCVIIGDDDCTGADCPAEKCTDPRYGDGVCQLDLECAAPDLDCFRTFEDDAAAAVWFADFERQLAMEQGREPRATLAAGDPRFDRTRALLDRGWDAFREHRPVGDLAKRRPALVFIDDANPNAFVAPDLATGNAGFAVMVQAGLLTTGGTEDGALGVMMHELQHAVGLHVVGDVRDRLRKFYVAPASGEPIGKDQPEDAPARLYGSGWRTVAGEVGAYSDVELGGLPLSGQLDQVLQLVIQAGKANNPGGCMAPVAQVSALRSDLSGSIDPLTGAITLSRASLPGRVEAALVALRDDCLYDLTEDFIEVLAEIASTTPDAVEAQMSPEDVALVKGRHVIDGLAALAESRRALLRGIEAEFAYLTGRPWTALRYFSMEEDADDVSVPVLRGSGLQPDGLGPFLVSLLAPAAQPRCRDLISSGAVPTYGIDLLDEHHSLCWRAHHLQQVADESERRAPRTARAPAPTMKATKATMTMKLPRRLPIPPPLSERIVH